MSNMQAKREDRPQSEGGLIEPETVLPVQLLGSAFTADLQPEKRLMLAVLEDAVSSFQKFSHSTYACIFAS